MTISKEQEAIINAPIDEKTIVMACAAAGKTFSVTERIRFLLRNGIQPNKIVAITFTNAAAQEMRERLKDEVSTGMYVGTMHSYANGLLNANGIDTHLIREEEEFDKLFDLIEMNPQVLRPVDYLICDECQDLDEQQFRFITNYIDCKGSLFVGDIRQSIYGFRGANPDCLRFLMADDEYTIRELTENYRNAKAIITFSLSFLAKMKLPVSNKIKPKRENSGSVIIDPVNFRLGQEIKDIGEYRDWAVLCRTNYQVAEIMAYLNKHRIPNVTFKQAAGSREDLRDKMNSNTVKVLTIHSAKGLEFNNVVVFNKYCKGDKEEELRLRYVAATRAKNLLYWIN